MDSHIDANIYLRFCISAHIRIYFCMPHTRHHFLQLSSHVLYFIKYSKRCAKKQACLSSGNLMFSHCFLSLIEKMIHSRHCLIRFVYPRDIFIALSVPRSPLLIVHFDLNTVYIMNHEFDDLTLHKSRPYSRVFLLP